MKPISNMDNPDFKKERKWLWIYMAIGGLFSLLFIVFKYPPFQDYPNHIIEGAIVANPEHFAPYYYVNWRPVPNLFIQVFLALVSKVTGLFWAGRIFHILYAFLFALGAFLFTQKYFNRIYEAGLVFFLFLANYFFWSGCCNFMFAMALFLIFLPLSSRIYDLRFSAGPWIVAGLSVILFFVHFIPAVLFLFAIFLLHRGPFKKWFLRTIISGIPIAILSVFYLTTSIEHGFKWDYGTGIWKISSVKRLLAIPYASTISSLDLFDFLNLYNLLCYLGFFSVVCFFIVHWKKILLVETSLNSLVPFLLALLPLYFILPSNLGPMDVDPRIIYTFLLLFLPWVSAHYFSSKSSFRAIVIFGVWILIATHFVASVALFSVSQNRIHAWINIFKNSSQSTEEAIECDQFYVLDALSKQSRLYGVLEKVKLHSDINQKNLVEEHVGSYFYLGGGFPRKVFLVGPIGKGQKK